jgi:hypothetical protein
MTTLRYLSNKALDTKDFLFKSYPTLDKSKLGLNAFFNQPLFSSDNMKKQADEIHKTLHINTVRILFHWDSASERDPVRFDFVDSILASLPEGLDALIIIGGAPDWLLSQSVEKRRTFYVNYANSVVARYAKHRKVVGFQVHNEPNSAMFAENVTLGLVNDPKGYMSILERVNKFAKIVAPKKLIVSASVTGILQNYPKTLQYLQSLLSMNIERACDVVGIHYYGSSAWAMLAPNGVLDTLRKIKNPIWITEIGIQKTTSHTPYLLKHMGYITEKVPQVQKVFWYHYDGDDSDEFALRTPKGVRSNLHTVLS